MRFNPHFKYIQFWGPASTPTQPWGLSYQLVLRIICPFHPQSILRITIRPTERIGECSFYPHSWGLLIVFLLTGLFSFYPHLLWGLLKIIKGIIWYVVSTPNSEDYTRFCDNLADCFYPPINSEDYYTSIRSKCPPSSFPPPFSSEDYGGSATTLWIVSTPTHSEDYYTMASAWFICYPHSVLRITLHF
jgi:hypothetical protein